MFLILTTQELSVNRIDLQAPALARAPRTNQGFGTPSCTTPGQPTVYLTPSLNTELFTLKVYFTTQT